MNIKDFLNRFNQWFAPAAETNSEDACKTSVGLKPSVVSKPSVERKARTKSAAQRRSAWWQARKAAAKAKRVRQQEAAHTQTKAAASQRAVPRKSAYQLIPEGATLLIDTANVLGAMDPRHAAHKLETIETSLVSRGFKTLFFIENRSLKWTCCKQETQGEKDALESFCNKSNVTRVCGSSDADLVILQMARALPDSVCVTRDRFRDYAVTYSEIVGTKRHRTCAAVTLDDKVVLSIDGLRDPIVIERETPQTAVVPEAVASDEVVFENVPQTILTEEVEASEAVFGEEVAVPVSAKPSRKGLLGVGDACRAKGNVAKAVALYGRAAKKDPSAYFDIADLYSDDEDGEIGYRRSEEFTQLGLKNAKKLRERKLRQARLRAEMHRGGGWFHKYRRAA